MSRNSVILPFSGVWAYGGVADAGATVLTNTTLTCNQGKPFSVNVSLSNLGVLSSTAAGVATYTSAAVPCPSWLLPTAPAGIQRLVIPLASQSTTLTGVSAVLTFSAGPPVTATLIISGTWGAAALTNLGGHVFHHQYSTVA